MVNTMPTRFSTLGDVGDLNAPIGSPKWATAVRLAIQMALADVSTDTEHLDEMLRLFRQHEGWRQLESKTGAPFPTYESFCTEERPWGLGYDPKTIERIVQERKGRRAQQARQAAAKVKEPPKSKKGGAPKGNSNASKNNPYKKEKYKGCSNRNGHTETKYGTSSEQRIKETIRDCGKEKWEEAQRRLEAGEFDSIAESIRWCRGEVPKPPRKTKSLYEKAQVAFLKLTKEEKEEFLKWAKSK